MSLFNTSFNTQVNTPFNASIFNRLFIIGVTLVSFNATPALAAPDTHWSSAGFDEPESALPHPTKPLLYVSNINGKPTELNGKGYISLLADDGSVIRHAWVMGMNAPKGMAIHNNVLYVADMQELHIIDAEKGELLRSVKADSSVMLNDVAVDDKGTVYISDMLGGGIYRYNGSELSQWISKEDLPHPNGLFFNNKGLIVATWGEGLNDDFSTEVLGGLATINLNTKVISPYKNAQQLGNLDGITIVGDATIVNDWMNGNVFEYKNGQVKKLFNAGKHASDISSKGDVLYVPMMFSKRIDAYKLSH
jgi:sugar lactone lactonase YvrE